MKTLFLRLFFLISLCTLFVSCNPNTDDDDDEEPTYTVYTWRTSYSSWSSNGNTLGDGKYKKGELSQSNFDSLYAQMEADNKVSSLQHVWTQNEIQTCLISRGFSTEKAEEVTSWLIGVSHGYIQSRTGSIVYTLVK